MKRYPVLTMIGICILILIFAPIIWGDREDAFWKFIYNFQSLLTGFFAIVAALITVHTMRETDDRQEARHQELMSLNLRRDRMIVRRANFPQMLDLTDHVRNLDGSINIINRCTEADVSDYFQGPHWNLLSYSVRNIREIMCRKQMVELEPLLPPKGLRAYQIIDKATDDFMEQVADVTVNLSQGDFSLIVRNFACLKRSARDVHNNIHHYIEEMANLANEYDVR